MQLRMVPTDAGPSVAVRDGDRWIALATALDVAGGDEFPLVAHCARDLVAFLAGGTAVRDQASALIARVGGDAPSAPAVEGLLPFHPRSFRDFSLYEQHMIQAARGLAELELPRPVLGVMDTFQRVTGKPFPKLRPGKLWYEQPVYYVGNHLSVYPEGATIPWPSYSRKLDYELELGLVVASPVRDASPEDGLTAIGGFVVVNDWSARDVQYREMTEALFGPVKSKGFATGIGAVVVTADEILNRLDALACEVRVNGELWASGSTAGMQHSLGDVVAYASRGEHLSPGELLATGTIPGCCGLEIGRWVQPGDEVTLSIEGVGTLRQVLGHRGASSAAAG